jgi:uncharacterized protein YbcV (DUF1398 family)
MILSKQEDTTIYPRCYDAASSAAPVYAMELYNRESDVLLRMQLTDTSARPTSFQKFTIKPWQLQISPGVYKYRIIDTSDSDKVLERGRANVTDINHTTTSHAITDTIRAHSVE